MQPDRPQNWLKSYTLKRNAPLGSPIHRSYQVFDNNCQALDINWKKIKKGNYSIRSKLPSTIEIVFKGANYSPEGHFTYGGHQTDLSDMVCEACVKDGPETCCRVAFKCHD